MNIIKEIKSTKWYQRISIENVWTTNSTESNQKVWKKVLDLVGGSESFKDKRVLDLGCNAGLYSVNCCLSGAKEVIGVEANETFFRQAQLVKNYFEGKNNVVFPITYVRNNISFLDFKGLGNFDYIFCLAILYHIGKHQFGKNTQNALNEQVRIIEILTKMSSKIIVRAKSGKMNSPAYYDPIFLRFGFKNIKLINEGKRKLILYASKI